MTQRTLAGIIALPLVIALVVLAWVVPLPYTIYSPGPTVNVLGKFDGKPIVQISGRHVYRDAGQLRMTTVSQTTRDARLGLWTLLQAWVSKDDAVYPHSVAYPETGTVQQDRQQGQVQMATAQDDAIAVALEQLGYKVPLKVAIGSVVSGAPAAGILKPGDRLLDVAGVPVPSPDDAVAQVQKATPGKPLPLTVERGGKTLRVTVTPDSKDGKAHLGVTLGAMYDFPFKVSINIDPSIGGPSAGLMMALSVYDTLTPGSLTDGAHVAGTGTIDGSGDVGPIGGIQQKIPGAMHDGAQLFLVPAQNCQDVGGADNGTMRLVKVTTFKDALHSVEAWTKDHHATLPTCGTGS